ncbi:MAG TPA: sel1 repeat family protein, partial [Pararhizobium sp.]|nr:sel1 repeat family protein [Pararhizobium sp.]
VAAGTWYILARRAGLQDNTLEDFFQGLTDEQQKEALKKANDIQAQ